MNDKLIETDKDAHPKMNEGKLFIHTPKAYNFLYELYILLGEKALDNAKESTE